MIFANFGVSMPVFVLGLLLAFLFAIVLKDTPFALPPSGRLSSGRRRPPAGRGLGPGGPDRARRGRSSTSCPDMYIFTALITGQWGALGRRRSAT